MITINLSGTEKTVLLEILELWLKNKNAWNDEHPALVATVNRIVGHINKAVER